MEEKDYEIFEDLDGAWVLRYKTKYYPFLDEASAKTAVRVGATLIRNLEEYNADEVAKYIPVSKRV